ncbi:TPA: hypothetical protein ACW0T4_003691 [Morganella morganii]
MTGADKGQAFIKCDEQLKDLIAGLDKERIFSDTWPNYQPPFGCASPTLGTPGGLIGTYGGLIGTSGDNLKSYAF